MSEGSTQFRGVTFGGFHRQDVLGYLSKREHEVEETVGQLRRQLEILQQEDKSDRQGRGELESSLHAEEARVRQLQDSLEEAQVAAEESNRALEQVQQELEQLRGQMAGMEQKAVAYDLLKERTAVIELDAHERAQITLKRAQSEARDMKEDCRAWVLDVQNTYEGLRAEINTSFRHSVAELEQVFQVFERVIGDFDTHEGRMANLVEQVSEQETQAEPEE